MSTVTTTPTRRTAGPRLAAVLAATAAAVAVWAVAHVLLDVDLTTQSGEVGLADVAVATPVIGLIAWGVLAVLERGSAHPRRAWTITACAVFLLSLAGPLGGEGTSAKVVLLCLHLMVALVIVPGYAYTAQRERA